VCQYIASTKLMWLKEGDDNSVEEVMKVAHQFVTEMQAPEAEQKSTKAPGAGDRRKTISALTTNQRKTGGVGEEINLERQFLVKFNDASFEDKAMRRMSTRRGTMAVLANRRASFINHERRRSSVGFTSINTRDSSFSSSNGYTNQGLEVDSVFDEEESFSDWTEGRPMGRNSVQFDVSMSDFQNSRV